MRTAATPRNNEATEILNPACERQSASEGDRHIAEGIARLQKRPTGVFAKAKARRVARILELVDIFREGWLTFYRSQRCAVIDLHESISERRFARLREGVFRGG